MSPSKPSAWGAFWQTVIRWQPEKLTPWLALRNAIGVSLPLALGVAMGQVPVGLAVATGALNVSFSDGQEPYLVRARRMLAASVLVGLAVFGGEFSGHNAWVAVAIVTGWAFAAGMLVSLSTTAADLGVISLVTLVVYSASPQPIDRAVYSGLFAVGGGFLQTSLALLFWPLRRYAPERRALAALFRGLARAAKPIEQRQSDPLANTFFEATLAPPATAESTAAHDALRPLDRDHSVQSERFRLLLSQAERTRLSLLMLARLRTRINREPASGPAGRILGLFFEEMSRLLFAVAAALDSGRADRGAQSNTDRLQSLSDALRALKPLPDPIATMVRDARSQMDALAGQLRSALDLAAHATPEGLETFERGESHRPWPLRLRGTIATLRANLCLNSAAFRHAIRLALCVGMGDALARGFGLSRAYWLPMTIAIVLKPDFTATFSRGVLRLTGTFAGLVFATGVFHLLPSGLGVSVAVIALLMYALRWIGPANYGIFVTAITALVVFLIAMTGVTPKDVMTARGLNTVAGGIIALVAYSVWPTWERTLAPEAVAQMLDTYRAYFRAVRESYEHLGAVSSNQRDRTRAAARLARSNVEASVDRLLAEPGTQPATASLLSGILASSHRLVHAIMALEAGLASSEPVPPRPAFPPFANNVEFTLYYLSAGLRGSPLNREALPDVRESHHTLIHFGAVQADRYALVNIETDRITNSLNTLSEELLQWISGKVPTAA